MTFDAYAHLHDHCENIDASVFSGALLFDDQQREMLREYAERWLRAIAEHEVADAKDSAPPDETKVYLLAEHCKDGGYVDVLPAASANDIRKFFEKNDKTC